MTAQDFIALFADSELLQLMLIACPDAVVAAGPDGNVLVYTGASERLFGFQPIEVLGHPVSRLFADAAGCGELLARVRREGDTSNVEVLAARRDGPPFSAELSAALLRDRYGAEVGAILYIRDHTGIRAIEDTLRSNNRHLAQLVERLNHIARHDQLTGLLYRGSAIDAAEAALIEQGFGKSFGVVLFDVDHFKAVNDSFGHMAGDEALSSLAGVMRSTGRAEDIVGRFGGEEFIAFLPGADLECATLFADRVRATISQTRVDAGDDIHITVTLSAGVAAIPTCAENLQEAIRTADDRLLAAKRTGRNKVVWRDDEAGGAERTAELSARDSTRSAA